MTPDTRSWADALFRQPGDSGVSERRADALAVLGSAIAESDAASGSVTRRYLDDPAVDKMEKIDMIAALVPDDAYWKAFATLVIRRRAVRCIPEIAVKYRLLVDKREGIERVVLESARPLDPATKQAVLDTWQGIRDSTRVIAEEKLMPELLGGFRLSSGSIRYDASIAGRLQRLESDLARPLDRKTTRAGGAP